MTSARRLFAAATLVLLFASGAHAETAYTNGVNF